MRKMRLKIYDKRGNWIELSNDDDEFESSWNLRHETETSNILFEL